MSYVHEFNYAHSSVYTVQMQIQSIWTPLHQSQLECEPHCLTISKLQKVQSNEAVLPVQLQFHFNGHLNAKSESLYRLLFNNPDHALFN